MVLGIVVSEGSCWQMYLQNDVLYNQLHADASKESPISDRQENDAFLIQDVISTKHWVQM